MATKPVLSARSARKTKLAVQGCEFERAFSVQYTVNSGFSGILDLKPVQEFYQAGGCVCGPANWMRQIFDIST